MLNEHGASTVKVKKAELLDALKRNRDGHKAAYEESFAGYLEELRTRLANAVVQAGKGIDTRGTIVSMETPTSHLKEYERAIRMLEMSVGTEVEVSEGSFRQLVLDEWDWKHKFMTVSSSYIKHGG